MYSSRSYSKVGHEPTSALERDSNNSGPFCVRSFSSACCSLPPTATQMAIDVLDGGRKGVANNEELSRLHHTN
eukprot:scaffold121551_cov39-Attheya_sp.AAC.3